ncbi:MAG TPA: helix-turn-helix transcriptional regulator [Ktedonobacteraceae bacterium]|nr:helix-turn-helix transcriptional regulator [Ktedonobacteraceae bacterium]
MKGKENKDPNGLITDAWSRNGCVAVTLLMLRQWNASGYALREKLAGCGLRAMNPGTFYRIARQMEKDGMVSSTWNLSVTGPARRVSTIPQAGEVYLESWVKSLDRSQEMTTLFFDLSPLPPAPDENGDGQVSLLEQMRKGTDTPLSILCPRFPWRA